MELSAGDFKCQHAGWCPVTWTDMQRAGGGVGTAWVYEGTAAQRRPLSLHAAVATVVPKGPAPGCTHQRCHISFFKNTDKFRHLTSRLDDGAESPLWLLR